MKNKKAAMEMSVGTLVTIVLLMAVLVLGMVLIRSIMCSGVILTQDINEKVKNELIDLFGTGDYGVKCMGEAGQEINLGDGGKRQIICVINTDESAEYELKINEIKSLSGVNTETVKRWALSQGWKGNVSPGTKTVTVLVLDIPRNVDKTNLRIDIEETNLDTGSRETHTSYIDISHVSGFNAAIC